MAVNLKLKERRYDIDWLRNIVVALLIPFHTARIYDYWEPNYVKSTSLSWSLSWFIVLIGYWFMPLMFWLAGASSYYSLKSRSGRVYLNERIRRLLVPLVFGVFFIVPPQAYLARLSYPGYKEGYFQFLSSYFRDFSDLSGYFGTFTPGHLWFIMYLLIISLVGLPIFLWLKSRNGELLMKRIAPFLSKPWAFISLFVLITSTEVLPAPGGKNPFFFFIIFLLGYITAFSEQIGLVIEKNKFKALILLLPILTIFIFLITQWSGLPDFSAESVALAFLRNLTLWLTIIVLSGYGKKYLSFNVKWLSYANQAAFPIYIIHQTVLLVIGYFVLKLGLSIFWEFLLILCLTFIACVVIYEFIIRRFTVTRWLFGIK